MVYRYYVGKVAVDGPFGTNNFTPRWSMRCSSDDCLGNNKRRDFISHSARPAANMQQNYGRRPSWEDSNGRSLKASNLRFYPQQEYVVRNQDFSPRELKTVLPPIKPTPDKQQQQNEEGRRLDETVGKHLFRHANSRLEQLKQTFVGMDKHKSGYIPTSSAQDVLNRILFKEEEALQSSLTRKYTAGDSEWLSYEPMLNYMRNARELYAVKYGTQFGISDVKPKPLPNLARRRFSGSSYATEITPKPNEVVPAGVDYLSMSHDHFHGASLRAAFADRRDAVLIIEMDKQFKRCSRPPGEMIDELRMSLSKMADHDETIPSYKVKSLMQKLKFPFNYALVDKLIERVDPASSGVLRWIDFIQFLTRSNFEMPANPRMTQNDAILNDNQSSENRNSESNNADSDLPRS